ncbi:MAG: hybrid sensor histidine kinase/response regulator [Methylococcaceae bacterium]
MIGRLITAGLLVWVSLSVHADVVDVARMDSIDLSHHIELCIDNTASQTIETVSTGGCPLQAATPRNLRPGYTHNVYWLRLTLTNSSTDAVERWLVSEHPRLEFVTLFTPQSGGWTQSHSGIGVPLRQHPIHDINPVLPLSLQAGATRTFWVRVASRSSFYLTPVLWMPSAYLSTQFDWVVMQTLPIGGFLLVTVFSAFMYISSRERMYLYFAGFTFSQMMIDVIYSGLMVYYFWPQDEPYNMGTGLIAIISALIFFTLFLRAFIGKEHLHKTPLIYNALLSVVTVTILLYLGGFVNYQWAGRWANVGVNLFIITVIGLFLRVHYQGYRLPWATWLSFFIILLFQFFNSLATWGVFTLPWLHLSFPWTYIFISPLLLMSIEQQSQNMRLQLRHAEATVQAKQWLFSQVSHELRAPLNTLLGYTQLLERHSPRVSLAEAVTAIQYHGRYLLGMIDEILDHLRGQTNQLRLTLAPVDLPGFLQSMENSAIVLAEAKGNRFRMESSSTLPTSVLLDERRVRQILDNLINNANHYTQQGDITLTVTGHTLQTAWIRLCFAVSDTGPGISLAEQTTIFEPFQRGTSGVNSRTEGVGMGLTIARQLAQLMSGEIRLHSRPGQGSTFTFQCDCEPITATAPVKSRPIIGYEGTRRTLMIVDDAPEHLRLLGLLLSDVGFQVIEADSYSAAQQQCTAAVDLVITDQFMADGMGWNLLTHLKTQRPDLPVILLSATLPQRPAGIPLSLDFNAHLIKPALTDTLFESIGILLGLIWHHQVSPDTDEASTPLDLPPEWTQTLLEMIDAGAITDILAWCDLMEARHPAFQNALNRVKSLALQLDFVALRQLLILP